MGQRYNKKTEQMEYVQDPFSAQLPDVKAAAQFGYHSFSRGMNGKIDSAIDANGRRVAFDASGQPPEVLARPATVRPRTRRAPAAAAVVPPPGALAAPTRLRRAALCRWQSERLRAIIPSEDDRP